MTTQQHEIPDTVQGKIDYANKLKEKGNEFFKKGDYKKAIREYKTIFMYVTGLGSNLTEVMSGGGGSGGPTSASNKNKSQIDPLLLSANLNLSACYLKLQMWDKAYEYAQRALKVEPDNTKAIFRRGEAQLARKDLDRAEQDLNNVAKKLPQDKAVQQALQRLAIAKQEHKKKEKNLYANIFQKMQNEDNAENKDAAK